MFGTKCNLLIVDFIFNKWLTKFTSTLLHLDPAQVKLKLFEMLKYYAIHMQ